MVVCQQFFKHGCGSPENLSGIDLIKGIITGYEVQVNLVKGICLHEHKIDHIAHLGPSIAAGLGSLLKLDTEIIYQSIQQALHTTISTRQSRKGEISSWKAFAPSHAGKLSVEAVDRAMRGENSPSPIYEGEDSVIAHVLSGKKAKYIVPLTNINEEKKAILETYTKEHSAEYQSQALIDLAISLNKKISNIANIKRGSEDSASTGVNNNNVQKTKGLPNNIQKKGNLSSKRGAEIWIRICKQMRQSQF